jgi:protein-L-isoaspartate(D-aspartate) O-methyltransferase
MIVRNRASDLLLPIILAGVCLAVTGERRPLPASAAPTAVAVSDESFRALRQQMVQEAIIGWGIQSPEVIRAMAEVPRHMFVPDEYLDMAYENHPLPIGHGQTISQPYIVALMTQELGVVAGDRVLEVGTGSGYQAAVLAECGVEVYSIEIIGALAEQAQAQLQEAGYNGVRVRHADGYWGWPDVAPFDGIIVTAAPDHVPQPLLEQLEIGGILIIPVGPPGGYQELWRIERVAEDDFRSASLGGVQFVPLTRTEEAESP